ncbi:MAG: YceI family protein [Acidobacteria bacterium]|nr:YceI family protein [Acidobacteriota bacterium]
MLFVLIAILMVPAANGPCVIPGRGHFRLHVGTSGIFGAFGHDHLIEARKITGCVTNSSVKLHFATSEIRVIDPEASAEERAKVQKQMETEVLRITDYPGITFESTAMERGPRSQLRVRGNLTIRNVTQPATIPVTLTQFDDGTYRAAGTYKFEQTSFGIKPIKFAGGTVRVKDEVRAEFELFLK